MNVNTDLFGVFSSSDVDRCNVILISVNVVKIFRKMNCSFS
jgi:hypothetical protein